MDEISPLIALPFKVGNLINGESVFATCVDVSGIELIASTRSLFCEPSMTKLPSVSRTLEHRNASSSVFQDAVVVKEEPNCDESSVCEDDGLVFSCAIDRELEGYHSQMTISSGGLTSTRNSLNLRSGRNGFCIEENVPSEPNPEAMLRNHVCRTSSISHKSSESWAQAIPSEIVEDFVSVGITNGDVSNCKPKRTFSTSLLEERKVDKQIFCQDFQPLWGLTSICGRRLEMEDSAVALPRFLKVPSWMLSESLYFSSTQHDSIAHVFGVYDGHGGCQVANYCRERLHVALAEEISITNDHLRIETSDCSLKDRWRKVFQKCFHRLDDEVGGFPLVDEDIVSNPPRLPIASESVGSTAVVAIVCSTHIIVGNCGDSRAVLCRGKVPVPLSMDHKPSREDECTRIEAAGGKVINWDGYRVSGVLAVSRSIGDRYLRPYVISDPEVTLVPRTKEDECLILASDGLWDVLTNDEACDLARKRILLWHKRYGATLPKERGEGIDPATQDAANFLSQVAFKRGSRDNISIIVVDLKPHRKFKKKN